MKTIFLFVLYLFSITVLYAQDIDKIKRKANKGNAKAKIELAIYYLHNGNESEKNDAYELLEKTYVSDYTGSYSTAKEYGLAVCLFNGYGVEKNHKRAFELFNNCAFHSGADNRLPDTNYYLAECYYSGLGGAKYDKKRAIELYERAAFFGSNQAKIQLGILVAQKEIKDSVYLGPKVCKWLEELSSDNYLIQFILGLIFMEDENMKNIPLSIRYLTHCANSKSLQASDSQYKLGKFYLKGDGATKDIPKALVWLEMSANSKNTLANYELGRLYYEGDNVKKDNERAKVYLLNHISTRYNDVSQFKVNFGIGFYAEAILGNIYFEEKNYEKAVQYYEVADRLYRMLGSSARNFAICYKWGYGGLLPSNKKSEEWMRKASSLGDKIASELVLSFK